MKQIVLGINFDVIDEITEPTGMKARLVQNHHSKTIAIQTWGIMTGEWITTQRHNDVQEMWDKSKTLAIKLVNRSRKGG